MRIKILILSLILILTISFTSYAADNSNSVEIDLINLDMTFCSINSISGYEEVPSTFFDSSSFADYNQLGYFTQSLSGEFDINYYYDINDPLNVDFNYNYIVVSVNVGALNANVLPLNNYLGYSVGESSVILTQTDIIESITVNYTGVEFNGVNLYYIVELDTLPFEYITFFECGVSYRQMGGSASYPFVSSPLKIQFFNNIDNAVDEIANSVNELNEKADVIINNLGDVDDKLDDIINAGPSQDQEESFNNELSKDNELHESYKNLENSYLNDVQSGLDVSIDYDISQFKDNLSGILGNSVITGFLGYLYSNPFIVVCFLVLPLFWLVYLVIFRG